MLITICIPTYKRPQLLKKAIESALGQSWGDLQVIVSDNASNDETAQVVAGFADPRLRYVCHAENIGMLGNYAYCLSQITTEYFSFLSDDDFLLPNFVEDAINSFQAFPECGFVAYSTVMLNEEKVVRVPLEYWPKEGRFEGAAEMVGKYPVPNTVLFRKSALKNVQIDFENPVAWDCDFLIQLASQLPYFISKKPAGIFRCHSQSYTTGQSYEASLHSVQRLIERVKAFSWMKDQSLVLLRLREDFTRISIASILLYIRNRKFREARKASFNLFRYYPLKTKTLILLIASSLCILFPFMNHFLVLLRKAKEMFRKKRYEGFEKYKRVLQ